MLPAVGAVLGRERRVKLGRSPDELTFYFLCSNFMSTTSQPNFPLAKTLLTWLVLLAVEFLHGTLRVIFLVPRVGDLPSRQIGVFTGSFLILSVVYFFIPWFGHLSTRTLLTIGFVWLILTVLFEFAMGRPDVILLDLVMLKMTGVEVAPILREIVPNAQIIIVTLFADSLGQRLASAIGVYSVHCKLDGLEKLADTLKSVAALHSCGNKDPEPEIPSLCLQVAGEQHGKRLQQVIGELDREDQSSGNTSTLHHNPTRIC